VIVLSYLHGSVYLLEQTGESFIASRIGHEKVSGISDKIPVFPNDFLLRDYLRGGRIDEWLFMVSIDQNP
jgi:hypothetical protein